MWDAVCHTHFSIPVAFKQALSQPRVSAPGSNG